MKSTYRLAFTSRSIFATMSAAADARLNHSLHAARSITSRVAAALVWLSAFTAASACAAGRSGRASLPAAEFIVNSTDSAFWVSTAEGAASVRGVPLMLAHYDGHFYELYTADEDFSYDDALLVGTCLYRRDLVSGDSSIVFADTAVEPVARRYALAHPDERPLAPDDEGSTHPSTTASAEIDVLDVFGPYLSYEYHVDVDLPGRRPWHATRRGVVDLRTGKPATLSDVFGNTDGRRLTAAGRARYASVRASALHDSQDPSRGERRGAAVLETLDFDDRSFSITSLRGAPAVAFAIPGHGAGAAGNVVALEPMAADSTIWWTPVVASLPTTLDDDTDTWTGSGYRVLARYDTLGEAAHVSLAPLAPLAAGRSRGAEWPITTVLGPIHRIDWLDRPRLSDADRKALTNAFAAAARYDENAQVAVRTPPPSLHLVSRTTPGTAHATQQSRSRKPARNLRADDAGARQQHGPRVRRRGAVDDGQMRRHRRVPA